MRSRGTIRKSILLAIALAALAGAPFVDFLISVRMPSLGNNASFYTAQERRIFFKGYERERGLGSRSGALARTARAVALGLRGLLSWLVPGGFHAA